MRTNQESKRRWRWARGVLGPFAISVLVGGSVSVSSGFRESELQCEEAYAHLEDCCGALHGAISCTYEEGCAGQTPALDVVQSKCIRKLSCSEIEALGMCDASAWRSDAGAPLCP
ncbi:MAG: hypothetical protein KC776_25355 [Myxococcales bacterium]|nr:hypothetical protein [Myxococcales bacterium]MCB9581792.1 hypothetical protein [Polyangiaceae bacterium]